jgi:hypothetical protein
MRVTSKDGLDVHVASTPESGGVPPIQVKTADFTWMSR